jgi:hypothetical protein
VDFVNVDGRKPLRRLLFNQAVNSRVTGNAELSPELPPKPPCEFSTFELPTIH